MSRVRYARGFALVALGFLPGAGCGGSTAPSGVIAEATCLSDPPSDGQPCQNEGAKCEYGMDLRPNCRTHATCTAGAWQLGIAGCKPLPGPGQEGCPALPPSGGKCDYEGLVCDMGAGAVCACGQCAGGMCSLDARWACASAPNTPGCPSFAPELGSACDVADVVCIYGVCATPTSVGRRCTGGTWADYPVACPV